MNTETSKQLANLVITVPIALLVWRHYRRTTFPWADRYSTFGPRFWTGDVDSLVLWPMGFVTSTLLSLNIPKSFAALLIIVQSISWLLYTVVMHARYGQTVGKMVTSVRVVDFATEGRISWRQAWLREGIPMLLSLGVVGYEVSCILKGTASAQAIANGQALVTNKPFWFLAALPGLWFLAEVLTMLTNEKRRALHDFIAGTIVVRTNAEAGSAQPDAAPNGGPANAFGNQRVTEGPPSVT